MAKLTNEEKIAKIAKKRKEALDKAKRLGEQERALRLKDKLEYYEKLNPIALAAIDVFGNNIPRNREEARQFFLKFQNRQFHH